MTIRSLREGQDVGRALLDAVRAAVEGWPHAALVDHDQPQALRFGALPAVTPRKGGTLLAEQEVIAAELSRIHDNASAIAPRRVSRAGR